MSRSSQSAFQSLETSIHELHYLSVLWSRMENSVSGEHKPDGTYVVVYDADDAAAQSFLGYEIERRSAALRRDYLACFEQQEVSRG